MTGPSPLRPAARGELAAPPAATVHRPGGIGVPRSAVVRLPGETLTWAPGLLLALAVALAIAWAWLDPHYDYFVDDGERHAIRAGVLDALLRRGGLFPYPRWWPDLTMGYGYPLLNYYAPGTYSLAVAIQLLGASTYRSLQLVALLSVLLGASGAYALGAVTLRRPLAALVLSVVYVGSPYPFITNLYNRAAFPEALGLAILPWLLAAASLCVQGRRRLEPLALGLALAALVLTHTLTAFVGAGVLLLWIGATLLGLPAPARRGGLTRAALGVGIGLALSAFFWLPALLEQRAVHTDLGWGGTLSGSWWLFDPLAPPPAGPTDPSASRYLPSPGLFDRNWVYPSPPSHVPTAVKPSLAQVLFLLAGLSAALITLLTLRHTDPAGPSEPPSSPAFGPDPAPPPRLHRSAALPALCLLLSAALWFMNTTWSDPVWAALRPLAVLQFPWRLYGPFSLTLAFAGAAAFAWVARSGQQQWILALLLAAFVAVNGRAGHPALSRTRPPETRLPLATLLLNQEGDYAGAGTLSGGEFLPRSVILPQPSPPSWSWTDAFHSRYPAGGWIAGRVWPLDGAVDVRQVRDSPTRTQARVDVAGDAPADVAFRTLVFPGWRAYVDGRPVPLRSTPYDPAFALGHGIAVVTVPPGEHDVQLALGSTLPRTLGTLLTIAGLAGAALLLFAPFARRRLTFLVTGGAALLATATLTLDLLPLLRPPFLPRLEPDAIVLDLAAGVRDGGAVHVSSPDGGRLGSFVDVRAETIAGHTRRWLYMHPPSEAHLQLVVPPRATLQTGVGVDPAGWSEPGADGVRFLIEVSGDGILPTTLLDETLQPQVRLQDRGWRFAEISLAPFAGRRVTLTFRTEGRDTPHFDWAGWATPTVYVDRSVRYPPPGAVPPALGLVPWTDLSRAP